jgi:CubicO group peptidase (beta-lactamase class C family)
MAGGDSDGEAWLDHALAAIEAWIDYQMRATHQVGCVLAVARHGRVVLDRAFGQADLSTGEAMTPRHRFRIASHSKMFTAAGLMRLREQGRLGLDDRIGRHLAGLHPDAAEATVAQLLSHTAGITRDGPDSSFFLDRRPFPDAAEVLAHCAEPPTIPAGTRFKYSNHGFALLGLVIEAVTGEPYLDWVRREVIEAFGLEETAPDMPAVPPGTPFARGHTGRLLLGERRVIPGDFPTNAAAPAAGFVSTAADLVRFLAQLSPEAEESPLSPASRREMARRHWRIPHLTFEQGYGLGTGNGVLNGWEWFGHTGGLQGYLSRSCVVPAEGLAVSVLVNALDGMPMPWCDGALHLLQAYARRGAPGPALKDWRGRWWTVWGAVDLLPMGDDRVLVALPAYWNPLMDAAEIEVLGPDHGRVALASGYGSHGEKVRLVRDAAGQVAELRIGGGRAVPEAVAAEEVRALYPAGGPSAA